MWELLLILLGIAVVGAIGAVLFWRSVRKSAYESPTVAEFLGVLMLATAGLASVIWLVFSASYLGAQYKADIINKEYGTAYTRMEIFWAEDVIEQVRQVQRIELNGNLINKD